QHGCPDVEVACLALCVYAYMVTIEICGHILVLSRIQFETDLPLQFALKAFLGPTVVLEQILQASALAVLTQNLGIAKNTRDTQHNSRYLVPLHECIQAFCKEWLGR